ncbi:MAG: phosphodiester glycosidase family protein [Trueperaceae bacterium]
MPTLPDRSVLRPCLSLLTILLLGACVLAQPAAGDGDGLIVPAAMYDVRDGAVVFLSPRGEVRYLGGLGWSDGSDLPPPRYDREGRLVLDEITARALGLPRIAGVRTGLDGSVSRIVIDLADVDASAWSQVRSETSVRAGAPVDLALPPVLVTDAALLTFGSVTVRSLPAGPDGPARLRIEAPDAELRVFPLDGPTRLVLDLAPEGSDALLPADEVPDAARDALPEARPDTVEPIADGVVYRRTIAPTAAGSSTVHVLELDPAAVELRVVGSAGEGRTVLSWADGAVAAINAGYFEPSTFAAIGLRRIDDALLSWPSRGRAVIGFGPSGVVVARASARVQIRLDGTLVLDAELDADGPLAWSDVPGAQVGSSRTGVLVLDEEGRVVRNRIGPARVPQDGGAVFAYDAATRPLALAEPGARVTTTTRLLPNELDIARWAIEAGPMLVADGRPAFAPEEERFARGVRILDHITQQAAVGVRPDGTVLFVVGERMVAEDLVDLFVELGARDALRMDRGSSSTLVADGRQVNRLLARQVESAIVAVPSERTAGAR